MPSIHGDWFHSRTSSNLSELAAIQLLVKSSIRTEYIGKRWGAGREIPRNKWLYDFSATAKLGNESIEPSTMQTKIRNWIRLGFLVDKRILPLEWTQMGLLWIDAVDNARGRDANILYELIIANTLATISFSERNSNYDSIPQENGLLLKFLFNKMQSERKSVLSKEELVFLIDGNTTRKRSKNYSYWIKDLKQSGLFKKHSNGSISINYRYDTLIKGISNYIPTNNISAKAIKMYPLAEDAPFKKHLIEEFKKYGSDELIEAVESIAGQKIYLSSKDIESRRYITRNGKWSKDVKNNYNYKCAVPHCDAQGKLFIEAAHIMPHSEEDSDSYNKHRDDLENGIALCLSCHKLFDGGLFTFDENAKILPSKFIYSSELVQDENQINVVRILDSKNKHLYNFDSTQFNLVYADFHRENIFLGE